MSTHFGSRGTFATGSGDAVIYRLNALAEQGIGNIDSLPFSIKILLENALRNLDGNQFKDEDIVNIANWNPEKYEATEIPYRPARVILQDFTGVPAVVDLAALRSAMDRLGGDPAKINPRVPVDLVIDHSVQVDVFGRNDAILLNSQFEFERNRERYEFLHWGQKAFDSFKVVPPATGIVHQVNLEYLAKVVQLYDDPQGGKVALPDTLVGTDSHTTMINGLGVLGWGVGGIEAEAVMLGQPIYMLMPEVVGFKVTGQLQEGATATDLVLTVTQMLREHGVVGNFVEYYGPGLDAMSLPDRATLANMAPEYGATCGFFPVDHETLDYLAKTGRTDEEIELVKEYYQAQGMYRTSENPDPEFSSVLELDLGTVEPSLAGPKRPQDRILLKQMQPVWTEALEQTFNRSGASPEVEVKLNGQNPSITDGSVVIAAITSCTNTSNPSVLMAAGLLAKKAAERGLNRKPWVKTSLAPGSRVVTDYLDRSGLTPHLEELGFYLVGYGCTTCIGNSGPLPAEVSTAVIEGDLVVASVLSGNRNFEGRINQEVKANYLASPPLVVAYAIAGTVNIDLINEPLGNDNDGNPVFLKDLWPTREEITQAVLGSMSPEIFVNEYSKSTDGPEQWQQITGAEGEIFDWQPSSTYVQEPPFFVDMPVEPQPIQPIDDARCLVLLGDSVTTDHISPAGAIKPDSPAGLYLQGNGVEINDFNSYGSRRGNDRVMTRGTFANIRLQNRLAPGTEGSWTVHHPTGEKTSIFDAALKYKESDTPLVVIAGAEYGTGSSRDWAAKGTYLLGVHAVIATSYERIHRSNLVGMGVLPLQFRDGEDYESLDLDGTETFQIAVDDDLKPQQAVEVTAVKANGDEVHFVVTCRIDTPVEVEYYRHGGILHKVLRELAKS